MSTKSTILTVLAFLILAAAIVFVIVKPDLSKTPYQDTGTESPALNDYSNATTGTTGTPSSGVAQKSCVVTGCSNTVCTEEGNEVATTCEFRAEYGCYQYATCGRLASGECGWTTTETYNQCLIEVSEK